MHTLANHELRVQLLDPVADRDRMGPRYCTGGYIFQIESGGRPLLSGPTYPDDFNWFDGQGIPDSFALSPLRNTKDPDARALIPGIGLCDTVAREVLEYCRWKIDPGPTAGEGTGADRSTGVDAVVDARSLRYATSHDWAGYRLEIERTVTLVGRVVISRTRLSNTGRSQIPVCWFPHPFYPIPDGEDLCALPAPVRLPEGTTYRVGANGYLRCTDLGALESVGVQCGAVDNLTVLQRHPTLGAVAARFSYSGHVLVWGNPNTFSFEPYLERTVGPGQTLEWTADYHF